MSNIFYHKFRWALTIATIMITYIYTRLGGECCLGYIGTVLGFIMLISLNEFQIKINIAKKGYAK